MIFLIALAAATGHPLNMTLEFGVGRGSCATTYQTLDDAAIANWILGYWTGLNQAYAKTIGTSTDGAGIIAEVKRRCAAAPASQTIEIINAFYRERATAER